MKKILITGAGGFIGFNLTYRLLKKNNVIVGVDNLNSYYSKKLKKSRINQLKKFKNFFFFKFDLKDTKKIENLFRKFKFDLVLHFAAQPGIRYSLINPKSYIDSNIIGFFNILESCKKNKTKKLIFASSSSLYGEQNKFPIKENIIGVQKNIYSLSKKQNEDMAKIYSNLYNLKIVGLRLFTVYGEWGRPDMFILKFLDALHKKSQFKLNNFGDHYRDFTYIKDVVDIILKLIKKNTEKYSVFNICSGRSVSLFKIINILTNLSNKKPLIKKISRSKVDVYKTHGSNTKINKIVNKRKYYSISEGLKNTYNWYIKNSHLI